MKFANNPEYAVLHRLFIYVFWEIPSKISIVGSMFSIPNFMLEYFYCSLQRQVFRHIQFNARKKYWFYIHI